MPENQKIKIYPINTIPSFQGVLANLILLGSPLIGLFIFFQWENRIAWSVSIFLGISGYSLIKSRHMPPEAVQATLGLLIPIALGLALSVYPTFDPTPTLLGAITGAGLYIWFSHLRFPALFRAAGKAYRAGNLIEALNLINASIQQGSRWEAFQFRSVIHLGLYQIVEAEQDARSTIRLNPDHYMGYNALGRALLSQQRYVEADQAMTQALEFAPNYAINYFNKGLTSYYLKKYDQAIPHLQRALSNRLPPELYLLGYYYLGSSLLKTNQTKQAQVAFDHLKRYKSIFGILADRYKNTPDYPSTIKFREELEEIRSRLGS